MADVVQEDSVRQDTTCLRQVAPCVETSLSRELTRARPDTLLSHCLRRVYSGTGEALESEPVSLAVSSANLTLPDYVRGARDPGSRDDMGAGLRA